jgi:hypothetical protein
MRLWFVCVFVLFVVPLVSADVLFTETFENANFASRGWYDTTNYQVTSAESVPGSGSSMVVTWTSGQTNPGGLGAMRRDFSSTEDVYLSYWVKYSSNYVGSQQNYHPHEFMFLTNQDGYIGPAISRTTAYIEQVGGVPLVAFQDSVNIDTNQIGVDLTGVSEFRSVNGCNGNQGGADFSDCYNWNGWRNGRGFRSPIQAFSNSQGQYYKGDWQFVEAFIEMNSVVGGIGQADGRVRYWIDGELLIDRPGLILRTGEFPSMEWDQLLFGPYIGDGSPVTQTMWVDNLTLRDDLPSAVTPPLNNLVGDLNQDGSVTIADLLIVVSNLGRVPGDVGFDARSDVNGDGLVNVFDLVLVSRDFGKVVDDESPVDTTPPIASINSPSAGQVLSAGTTSTLLSVTTNEVATCRWSTSDQVYSSMPSGNVLSGAGTLSHSATLSGLANGQSYTRYVRCIDVAGNAMSSSESRSFSVAADTTPPSAVTGLSATTPFSTQASLTWNPATDNVAVTSYRVERCQGSSCSNFVEVGSSASPSFVDTGLSGGFTYSYRVRARDGAGNNGAYSSVILATTPHATPVVTGVCGSRATTYLSSVTDWPGGSTYCSSGTASAGPMFPAAGASVSWDCVGSGGGSTASCTATRQSTPPPAGSYEFTNLPAGMTVHSDAQWTSSGAPGWTLQTGNSHPNNAVRAISDPTSPTGGAAEMFFPQGLGDGLQPGGIYMNNEGAFGSDQEIFIGVVMKYSANWIPHSNQVKLHLVHLGQYGWLGMFDGCWGSGVGHWTMANWGSQTVSWPRQGDCMVNTAALPSYTPGTWVKQEIHIRRSSPGQSDGFMRVWIDGTLTLDATGLRFADDLRFGGFHHAGTWGGGGPAVPHDQSLYVARSFVASR